MDDVTLAGDLIQHLHHGGHKPHQIRNLLGYDVAAQRALLQDAEQRHGKRCKSSCIGTWYTKRVAIALCPYCSHLLDITLRGRPIGNGYSVTYYRMQPTGR